MQDTAVMATTISRATIRAALHRAGIGHPADPGYQRDADGQHVTLDFDTPDELIAFLGALWSLMSYEDRRNLCGRSRAERVADDIHVLTFRDTVFTEDLFAGAPEA